MTENRQQQVTPEIGRHRNLQRAGNLILGCLNFLQTGMHHVQHLAGIGQPDLAFRCQPQTTRGARKQAYGQRGLRALDGGTDTGRLDADFARRITKTVKRRGADEQREIFAGTFSLPEYKSCRREAIFPVLMPVYHRIIQQINRIL